MNDILFEPGFEVNDRLKVFGGDTSHIMFVVKLECRLSRFGHKVLGGFYI